MSALEEIRSRFKNDHFAVDTTGIRIDSAEPGKSVCSLTLEERHMNNNHVPMGGAIFTLADFACAIAANGYSELIRRRWRWRCVYMRMISRQP